MQILASQANSGVNIGYYNLPQGACNSLAIAITFSPDVIWESISGNAQFLPPLAAKVPYTTAAINGFCAAGNGNSVQVLYKAR